MDDTLIDTSGSVTPFKLRLALNRMVEAGLQVSSFLEAYLTLKEIDNTSESTRDTLIAFLERYQAPPLFLDLALKAFIEPLPENFTIATWGQTHALLSDLSKEHKLAIVTMGNADFQMEKMKKAGLELALFCKIIVSTMQNKKTHYKSIMEELGFGSQEVIVCGDRIGNDLSPAKELGIRTVQILKGRGKNSKIPREDVDFTINEIEEIKTILTDLTEKVL